MYLTSPKAYLFLYSDVVGTREQVKSALDSMTTVTTWRYDLPNAFYIVSPASAQELFEEFERKLPSQGRFLFTEYDGNNSQGRLTGESWYLLNNKTHKPANS